MDKLKHIRWFATGLMILALFVVMLGAYTRLTNAGLGCPDWPGCYGHPVLSASQDSIQQAQHLYPDNPLELRKAWTEMAHRYAAGTLVLGIVLLAFLMRRKNRSLQKKFKINYLLIFVLLLLLFQALLGMWTVTLKLLPVVVMGHLLGGILIFTSLCLIRCQISTLPQIQCSWLRRIITLGCCIVFAQIVLGGWVSSNYAGISCLGFPTCNGHWWPHLNILKAFNVFSSIGANYQGGLLDSAARVTIQWVHRLGAGVVLVYLMIMSGLILYKINAISCDRRFLACIKLFVLIVLGLLLAQFVLGIVNVIYFLPLGVAVMHNGVAALLLATLVGLRYLVAGKDIHVN